LCSAAEVDVISSASQRYWRKNADNITTVTTAATAAAIKKNLGSDLLLITCCRPVLPGMLVLRAAAVILVRGELQVRSEPRRSSCGKLSPAFQSVALARRPVRLLT
jgi:hypothetical protein